MVWGRDVFRFTKFHRSWQYLNTFSLPDIVFQLLCFELLIAMILFGNCIRLLSRITRLKYTMQPELIQTVLTATGAQALVSSTIIQSLWSGYGQIVRLELEGGRYPSVILKHIRLPNKTSHPRGWNTSLSHKRKIRSYQIEAYFYQHYAVRCYDDIVVANCLAVNAEANETVLVLTDLDAAGFDVRKTSVNTLEIYACLNWLASFHARFLNSEAQGLWECGSYWHLDTRPDELAALNDVALREAAPLIDQKLKQARYQTVIHGDAKLANFCFRQSNSDDKSRVNVAAVDFQYVGLGCGMKDVTYFLGSCLNEDDCEAMEEELLDYYFSVLKEQVEQNEHAVVAADLEHEWRALYPIAWADFHRFIKGWSPGHWKINSYSERLTKGVIKSLKP